ncbi:hypothetical protein LR392_14995 [Arthrobacter sp. AK04]|nr:hypothetical protein [Arthrobacter sp. AK04]MCD5343530.1 hypothetical protein [Arthrobacter sp. AK04]
MINMQPLGQFYEHKRALALVQTSKKQNFQGVVFACTGRNRGLGNPIVKLFQLRAKISDSVQAAAFFWREVQGMVRPTQGRYCPFSVDYPSQRVP